MGEKKLPLAKQLAVLAMQFRGTREDSKRRSLAREYSQVVNQLIVGKKWRLIPPLEDQLPDEWMPESFFEHWSLHPPKRHVRRRA